jgi:hypothetical protein
MSEEFRVTVTIEGEVFGPFKVTAKDAMLAIAVVKFKMYDALNRKKRLKFEAEPWNRQTVTNVTEVG